VACVCTVAGVVWSACALLARAVADDGAVPRPPSSVLGPRTYSAELEKIAKMSADDNTEQGAGALALLATPETTYAQRLASAADGGTGATASVSLRRAGTKRKGSDPENEDEDAGTGDDDDASPDRGDDGAFGEEGDSDESGGGAESKNSSSKPRAKKARVSVARRGRKPASAQTQLLHTKNLAETAVLRAEEKEVALRNQLQETLKGEPVIAAAMKQLRDSTAFREMGPQVAINMINKMIDSFSVSGRLGAVLGAGRGRVGLGWGPKSLSTGL